MKTGDAGRRAAPSGPAEGTPASTRPSGPNHRGPAAGRPDGDRARQDKLTIGRLEDFGRAPYQFRANESGSFFVKILTIRGERILWGKDLERALSAAATQPKRGDQVGARRTGREAVTIVARERDADGRITSQSEQQAHRSRWIVEKVQFFAERAKLAHRVREAQTDIRDTVQSHPELKSTFLTLRGAREIAERRIADPRDRARFLILVREAMAGSIKRGEPLPEVRIREPRNQAASVDRSTRAPPKATRRNDEPTR